MSSPRRFTKSEADKWRPKWEAPGTSTCAIQPSARLRLFCLRLPVDRNIGVGVFPNVKEFVVRRAGGCVVAHRSLRSTELKPLQRAGFKPGKFWLSPFRRRSSSLFYLCTTRFPGAAVPMSSNCWLNCEISSTSPNFSSNCASQRLRSFL